MNKKESLIQELKLRRLIRKAIKLKQTKKKRQHFKQQVQEKKLRQVIRQLMLEGDVDSDTKPAPYQSTPVNALADAFNQILPVLKSGLRKLAQADERISYRMHVLEKFKSIFDSFEGLDAKAETAIGESDINEQEGEKDAKLTISLDDPDRVMPSDGKEDDRFKEAEVDPEQQLEDEFEAFKMEDVNPTGARVAFETINDSNIVQVLSDKRKTIAFDPQYKEEFKDYALYNVDLWLNTYEKELADSMGQQPAFTKTIMPKPEGAEVRGGAEQFDDAGGEFESELEELLMMENEHVGE